MPSAKDILKQYWGFDTFRPVQAEIIDAVLSGEDVLALLPTGGGKSVCFQVPALMKEGICIVVSPLIALIKDQVENLAKKNISALSIHSGMNFFEIKKTLEHAMYGNCRFLYVSPERLLTGLFLEYLPGLPISMIAVDESHCISQWGYDFRPAYLKIAELREHLPGVPMIALTASATPEVQKDICEKLLFDKGFKIFRQSFERPNLSYSVFTPPSKETQIIKVLNNVPGCGIVYCKSRKRTQQIAELLRIKGISADFYHAGLATDERNRKQQQWVGGHTRVMVCTNAFGMGIDKPDVRTVIHADVPDCLENYYQEAGRAGRDGKRSYAVLLCETNETEGMLQAVNTKFPGFDSLKKIYFSLMNALQVAAGSGEAQSFDFDIVSFSKKFGLDALQVTNAIKFFQQQGLLTFNEVFFKPSTAQFTAPREAIEDFERNHPTTEPLIKGLLRSYEGIFDFPVNIFETAIAKFIKMPIEKVREGLLFLHRFGIINYIPAADSPQIYLLQNRMYAEAFTIDMEKMNLLKARAIERIRAVKEYIETGQTCRSEMLSIYFGEQTKACVICDNCIAKKQDELSSAVFNLWYQRIVEDVKHGKNTIGLLSKNLNNKEQKLQAEVLAYMIREGVIIYEKEILTLTAKG